MGTARVFALLTLLGVVVLLTWSLSARATVACNFEERRLGSFIIGSERGKEESSCGTPYPAYVMSSNRQKLLSIGDVHPLSPFQLVEDRYLFWDRLGTVHRADLRLKTANVVFAVPALRGASTYTASPHQARVALVARGLVTWVPSVAKPVPDEHILYIAEKSSDILRPLAWSDDEQMYWFCRTQLPSHRVRIMAGALEGPAFSTGWLSGEVPACTSSTRAFNLTEAENFDANRGLVFQYTFEAPGARPHIWLHDVLRNRAVDLGQTDKVHVPRPGRILAPVATFQADGACDYETTAGRRHVADCATLLPPN